jgi:hypothetical protein
LAFESTGSPLRTCSPGTVRPLRIKEQEGVFFRYPDILEGELAPEKQQRTEHIAADLPDAEIVSIARKFVILRGERCGDFEADVTPTGVTVYLGGFDWVTFPTPPHILQEFPELIPAPTPTYGSDTDDLLEDAL